MSSLFPNYARLPVEFTHGNGVWLWDTQGKQYLDALSGIAVCSLGHAHPAVTRTVCDQAQKLTHTSNLYQIATQKALAEKLTDLTGLDTAFFCNSGTEANEAAIKLIRLHAHEQNNATPKILVMEGAFHGRTFGALSASDLPNNQRFIPLLDGFIRVPYNDTAAVKQAIQKNPDICALLVEPIQGENGVQIPDADYLPTLRQICDKHQILLVLDEIQTGIGRTGRWYAFMHKHCKPDILTSAKALGNGIPIGVCLAKKELAPLLMPGTHGSTFGGNPLACAVGMTVLETIETQQLCKHAETMGAGLLSALKSELEQYDTVITVRGQGLMIGIELNQPCKSLQAQALNAGLLINVTAERVIRLLPPLILKQEHADTIVNILSDTLSTWTQ